MGLARLSSCCVKGLSTAKPVRGSKLSAKDASGADGAGDEVQVIAICDTNLEGDGLELQEHPLAAGGGVAVRLGVPGERPRRFAMQAFLGPQSTNEQLPSRASLLAQQAAGGRCGAVLACGAAGCGKRQRLLGAPGEAGLESAARHVESGLFDHMEAKCRQGDVFILDVSLLQISFKGESRREQLRDLLADAPAMQPPLRLLPDPLRPGCFAVDGLRRAPIFSRGDLGQTLQGALGRCGELEQNCHVVATINIDRIGMNLESGMLAQTRSRLLLVDAASCDNLGKAAGDDNYGLAAVRAALRPCRQIKAVRTLATRRQDSSLNLLLDGCVGPGAESPLLLVHVGPAGGGSSAVAGALAFAEKASFASGLARVVEPKQPAPRVRFRSGRFVAAAATMCDRGARVL